MGWNANRTTGRTARSKCNGTSAQPNRLLSECVHLVVQFCVVAMGRVATTHRLDCIEWYHINAGSDARACMGSRLSTIGYEF